MISLHNMLPFELTKYTPYLALSGELWSVFYEYFNRNWSCYKGFLLYNSILVANVVRYGPVWFWRGCQASMTPLIS